ncbi:sugar transferase, partial [Klebsiella aerogenes]
CIHLNLMIFTKIIRGFISAWYVKNWSMWNDLAILFKTVGVVLKKDGAY